MPRKRNPRHLLKSAEAPLDGVAALLRRAADRMTVASAYAGDGATTTGYDRFFDGVRLVELAMREIDHIGHEHISEER